MGVQGEFQAWHLEAAEDAGRLHTTIPVAAVVDIPAVILALVMLSADLGFIALHWVQCCTPVGLSSFFSLERDAGFAEVYQYLKEMWAALLLTAIAWRSRAVVYLAWAALAAYLLLDDALRVHEQLGTQLILLLDLEAVGNLRAQDFGELGATAIFAAVLLGLVAWAHRRSPEEAQSDSRRLVIILLALAGFGVGFDMLHSLAGASADAALWSMVEDGGELVTMTLFTSCCFMICCRRFAVPKAS